MTPPRSQRIYRRVFERTPVTKIKMHLSAQKCCGHICGYLEGIFLKKKNEFSSNLDAVVDQMVGFQNSVLKHVALYILFFISPFTVSH